MIATVARIEYVERVTAQSLDDEDIIAVSFQSDTLVWADPWEAAPAERPALNILYAADMRPGTASFYRAGALERLGHRIIPVDASQYELKSPLLSKIAFRLAAGPHAQRLNRDLLRLARTEKPDILWADKLLLLQPRTLKAFEKMGIATVSYMIDNPFGPRRDPGWRLYMKDLPLFDLHIQQRDVSLAHYRQRGARDVMKVLIGFEPTVHFPSPEPMADSDRDRCVSFVGTPYDDRAEVLTRLAEAGLPVTISGNERAWRRALNPDAFAAMFRAGELYADAYREAIWRSKINISFLTKSNQDEYTQKSFEIAGCGGFLLAERSQGHSLKFKEDEEAVFFSTADELIEKVRRYLPDEAARSRIAAAGHARAMRDGYDSDSQVGMVLARVSQIMERTRPAPQAQLNPFDSPHAGRA
jgi:spore maturation protein CgeB